MAIIRTRREKSYTVIPNEIINDSRLQWQELGLLVYLLSKPADWDIRVPVLAAERDLKERAVYNAMKRFRELGYATFKKHQDGTAEWTITDAPQDETPPEPQENSSKNNQMSKTANCGIRKQQKPQIAVSASSKNRNVIQSTEDFIQKTDERDIAPEPKNEQPKLTRRTAIAILLRKQGVNINGDYPPVVDWERAGITDEELTRAVGYARQYKPDPEPIIGAYLAPIVGRVLKEREKPPASSKQQPRASTNQTQRTNDYGQRTERQQRKADYHDALEYLIYGGDQQSGESGKVVAPYGSDVHESLDATYGEYRIVGRGA